MRSLSRQLSLSLALSLTLFFLLLAVLFVMESESLSEKTMLARMEHDMESVLAVTRIEHGRLELDQSLIDAIFKRPFSGHYYQLQMGDQLIRSRSLWDEVLESLTPGVHADMAGPRDQHLLLYVRSFTLNDQQFTITVAEDTTHFEHQSRMYQKNLLLLFGPALLLLLTLQVWVIRRSLGPLEGVGAALRHLEQGETRQLELELPAEIMPLVSQVNRLLLVMHERMLRSRTATGNLAHALKTPLAVIHRALEDPASAENSALIAEQSAKIEALIERELSRARLAGGGAGGFWPEPEVDLQEIVAILRKVHGELLNIVAAVEQGLHPALDREDMLELAGNLLDNACKWAKARVHYTLAIEDDVLLLTVEDDGPGMSESEWQALTRRGARSDESKPGHGLGLSIVADIVAGYQGELSSSRSERLGGLSVRVALPLRA